MLDVGDKVSNVFICYLILEFLQLNKIWFPFFQTRMQRRGNLQKFRFMIFFIHKNGRPEDINNVSIHNKTKALCVFPFFYIRNKFHLFLN